MKAATINELKKSLQHETFDRLLELTLRLARFKKENKELLTYLLFDANDVNSYVTNIKHELQMQFDEMNVSNIYFVKKTLRKILRTANKFIKYSGSKVVEVEVLLFFCKLVKSTSKSIFNNNVIHNIYTNQLSKIDKAIYSLHEDEQYDYLKMVNAL